MFAVTGGITLPAIVADVIANGSVPAPIAKEALQAVHERGFGSDGVLVQHFEAAAAVNKPSGKYADWKRKHGLPDAWLRGKSGNVAEAVANPESKSRRLRFSLKGKTKRLSIAKAKPIKYLGIWERGGALKGFRGKSKILGRTKTVQTGKQAHKAFARGQKWERITSHIPTPIFKPQEEDRATLDPIVEQEIAKALAKRGLI